MGGLSTSGRRVDTALWLDPPPPPKGSIDAPPQNLTETDPRAPEVTWTENSAKKKWKWDFCNQRVEGVQIFFFRRIQRQSS